MSARVSIELGSLTDVEAVAIVREDPTGWILVAVCADMWTATKIVKALGGKIPVDYGERVEFHPVFLRSCIVDEGLPR